MYVHVDEGREKSHEEQICQGNEICSQGRGRRVAVVGCTLLLLHVSLQPHIRFY